MLFGKKKKITPSRIALEGNQTAFYHHDRRIDLSELYGAFNESEGRLTIWQDNAFLTSVSCSAETWKALKRNGFKTCSDYLPKVSNTDFETMANSDIHIIGGDIYYQEVFFHPKLVELVGTKVMSDNKEVATLKEEHAGKFSEALNQLKHHHEQTMSGDALERFNKDQARKLAEKERVAKEQAEQREYERQLKAGFPDIVLTTEAMSPFPVMKRLGIVSAEYAHRTKLLQDVFAEITSIGKQRSQHTQSALRKAREVVLLELKKEAYLLGANAVVAVDLDYSEVGGAGDPMMFLVANGTAIKANFS